MNLPKSITVNELAELLTQADMNKPNTFPFHITIDNKDYICGIGCPEKITDVLEEFNPNGFWTYIMSLDDQKFVYAELEGMLNENDHKESLEKYLNLNSNSNIILTSIEVIIFGSFIHVVIMSPLILS